MTKIGVIGHTGKVGKFLIGKSGCVPLDCDIRSSNSIREAIAKVKPDVIASLASKADVEWCEKQKNFDEMYAVNVVGVNNLGMIVDKLKIPSVILSTDHIFPGKTYFDFSAFGLVKSGPYKEGYRRIAPVNYYGMSKFGAETVSYWYEYVKIVRTSYLFNQDRIYPVANEYPDFFYRSFLHLEHFAELLYDYLNRINKMPKVLHLSGSKTVNWHRFMEDMTGRELKKRKNDLPGYAPRPYRAGLVTALSKKLGFKQYNYLDAK